MFSLLQHPGRGKSEPGRFRRARSEAIQERGAGAATTTAATAEPRGALGWSHRSRRRVDDVAKVLLSQRDSVDRHGGQQLPRCVVSTHRDNKDEIPDATESSTSSLAAVISSIGRQLKSCRASLLTLSFASTDPSSAWGMTFVSVITGNPTSDIVHCRMTRVMEHTRSLPTDATNGSCQPGFFCLNCNVCVHLKVRTGRHVRTRGPQTPRCWW